MHFSFPDQDFIVNQRLKIRITFQKLERKNIIYVVIYNECSFVKESKSQLYSTKHVHLRLISPFFNYYVVNLSNMARQKETNAYKIA